MGRRDFVGVRALSPLRISFSRFYGERPFDVILRLGLLYPYQDNNPGLTHARLFSNRDNSVCVPPLRCRNRAGAAASKGPREATRDRSAVCRRIAGGTAAQPRRSRGLARRFHPVRACERQHRRRNNRRREGWPGAAREGLWLRRHRKEAACRSASHAIPPWIGLKALHLDCRHAAGRARQARTRRRRQPVPRLQDSARSGRRAPATARHHDPHARFRGGNQGAHLRG